MFSALNISGYLSPMFPIFRASFETAAKQGMLSAVEKYAAQSVEVRLFRELIGQRCNERFRQQHEQLRRAVSDVTRYFVMQVY